MFDTLVLRFEHAETVCQYVNWRRISDEEWAEVVAASRKRWEDSPFVKLDDTRGKP